MDVVFHCATAAPAAANTANRKLMHDVNVLGTRHLLDACAAAGVRHLVYTSSASVRGCFCCSFQTGTSLLEDRRQRTCKGLLDLSCPAMSHL